MGYLSAAWRRRRYCITRRAKNSASTTISSIPTISDDYAGEIARNGQRVITFIVYLNDDYDGGETAFPQLGFEHKGRRGGGIYFVNALPDLSPDKRMLHAGRPPTRGEKWIVSQFIRDRPMR